MLILDQTVSLVRAPASEKKTLHEDYRFYAYSLAALSLRFTYSVTLPDHPHVQNVTTPLLQFGLLWMVVDVSADTINWRDLSNYEEITVCKACSYGDPEFSSITTPTGTYTSRLRKGFASDYHWKYYTQIPFRLLPLKTRMLILTPESFRMAPHQSSWPERRSLFFCVFDKINREHQSSVVQNPHHTYFYSYIQEITIGTLFYSSSSSVSPI